MSGRQMAGGQMAGRILAGGKSRGKTTVSFFHLGLFSPLIYVLVYVDSSTLINRGKTKQKRYDISHYKDMEIF